MDTKSEGYVSKASWGWTPCLLKYSGSTEGSMSGKAEKAKRLQGRKNIEDLEISITVGSASSLLGDQSQL